MKTTVKEGEKRKRKTARKTRTIRKIRTVDKELLLYDMRRYMI